MRRRIAALLMVVGFMLASAAPAALAQPEDHPGQGSGAIDSNPGRSEGSKSHVSTPPPVKPGGTVRDPTASEHDTSDPRTGRGKRNS
jgi:hypothetical protein